MKVYTTKAIISFTVFMWCLFFLVNFCRFPIWTVDTHSSTGTKYQAISEITCDRSNRLYDLCKINGSTVLDPSTSTFYAVGPPTQDFLKLEKIKPYTIKFNALPMSYVKELTLTSGQPCPPACQVHHSSPALVFSAGGFMVMPKAGLVGNYYHDINDAFIPLFITINTLYQEHDQDLVLVISDVQDWWVDKYTDLLQVFSKHPIINLDKDNTTHCFPSATVGLISHGDMNINSSLIPNTSKTLAHFSTILKTTYAAQNLLQPQQPSTLQYNLRPRLVLLSRSGHVGRTLLNQKEVEQLAYNVGFDVTTFEPLSSTPLNQIYGLINSSHVVLGVHGAALTHLLFLRPGAVLLQVVPLELKAVADAFYGTPAETLGAEYIEYEIRAEESSLTEKYGKDSLYIKDPSVIRRQNWRRFYNIYFKEQNVRLDLPRFEKYLRKAYYKAKKLMDSEIIL